MNNIFLVVLGILCVGFYSCDNKVKKGILDFRSKTFTFPEDLECYYKSKDTIVDEFCNSKLKLVVYTGSNNCTSCSINNILLWEDYISYAENNDNHLSIWFIFNPNAEEAKILKNNEVFKKLKYPIILDVNSSIEKLNPILKNNSFLHTFLLDENNKVILVGNPLNNKEIEKLFYKITQERLAK